MCLCLDLKVKNVEPPKATFTQSNNLKLSGTTLKMCKFQNLIKGKVKKVTFITFGLDDRPPPPPRK